MSAAMCGCQPQAGGERERTLIVFAAASLASVAEQIGTAFREQHGIDVVVNIGASSGLARQIESGAAAHVFLSAHPQWCRHLEEQGRIVDGSSFDLAYNRLVLVVPEEVQVDQRPVCEWSGPLAMADPDHVPAGVYAKQTLETLGCYETMQTRTIRTPHVRSALRLAEVGEVDAAIVYLSDAISSPKVRIATIFDADWHEEICVRASLIHPSGPEPQLFAEFLRAPRSRQILTDAGFSLTRGDGS